MKKGKRGERMEKKEKRGKRIGERVYRRRGTMKVGRGKGLRKRQIEGDQR